MTTKATPGALGSNDQLGPLEPRWYVLCTQGLATLCATEADARTVAAHADIAFPSRGPHRVVLLGDVAAERERIASNIRSAMGHAEAGYDDVAWRLLASLVGPNAMYPADSAG